MVNVLVEFKRACTAYSLFGVLFEHVLPNELDWVLGSLLCQLFKRLNELGHDVGVQVLADGQIGVGSFLGGFRVFGVTNRGLWVYTGER